MPAVSFYTGTSEHGFVAVRLTVRGIKLPGIQMVSYGDSLDWSAVEDSNGYVVAHAQGGYKSDDLEIEVRRTLWDRYVTQVGADWRTAEFECQILRRTPGLDEFTDTVVGCRHKDVKTSNSKGDALTVKPTFVTRGVLWAGVLPFPEFKR